MTRPNFLVIGAMKAGTTSLHYYLDAHPQVFMSRSKELHFFVDGLKASHGWDDYGWQKGWAWYEEQFAGARRAVAIGESSPSYTAYPLRTEVPARIAQGIPDARFIYLLRHPLERARSEYIHKWSNGRERRPIATALLEDPVYLDKSRYASQIEQYLAHFPMERLLLVVSEDLRSDRVATMGRIWDFLGVGPLPDDSILDREHHRSEEQVSRARRLARGLPGYTAVARRAPSGIREIYGTVTRVRHDARQAEIPDDLRREMERRLGRDLERLRDLAPEAVARWGY